jgi:hypothetical protein
VIPAAVTRTKGQIDEARAEVTAEVKADVKDGQTHADDADVQEKADSAAKVAFLQQADPTIATDENAERSNAAGNINQAAQDEVGEIKSDDTATEKYVDDLVADGEKLVDSEAKANKTYTQAVVGQAVNNANTQAQNTAATVAAEPDSNFTAGQTIGVPGIYIDINGVHADFTLPIIDGDGKLVEYRNFWFGLMEMPAWYDLRAPLGMLEGQVLMTVLPASFNPETKYDFFVPAAWGDYLKMLRFAMKTYQDQGMNYSMIFGQHCVGFTIDTMDHGNLFPKYDPMPWTTGIELAWEILAKCQNAVELPGSDHVPAQLNPKWIWE